MRKRRLILPGEGWYHVTSRCCLQQFLFGAEDKEMFVRMMRACARFSGIDVAAFAVLDNHFHILAHIPAPSAVPEEEVLARVAALYGAARADDMRRRWREYREGGHARFAERELDALRSRMGDLSKFLKILKLRFSVWYRDHHGGLVGTIWQGRFGSTLVEGEPHALCAVAAYIDLNPVRAGIVKDPKNYRWSSYGAATAGVRAARSGYALLFGAVSSGRRPQLSFSSYRQLLYLNGAGAFDEAGLKAVIASRGRLSIPQLIRCRVRYMTAGAAFGSQDFLDAVFEANRDLFGPNRRTGARGIGLCEEWDGIRLCTMRDLRVAPVTVPIHPPPASATPQSAARHRHSKA